MGQELEGMVWVRVRPLALIRLFDKGEAELHELGFCFIEIATVSINIGMGPEKKAMKYTIFTALVLLSSSVLVSEMDTGFL